MDITTRNATLQDMVAVLKEQRAQAVDLIVPAASLRAEGGTIKVTGAAPHMDDAGVTDLNGLYTPTKVADEGLAYKLGIHGSYMTRMRTAARTDLWDANVNGWLHGDGGEHGPDGRKFMARLFRGDAGERGVLRALLSDRYGVIDNLDVLTATLSGIREAGVNIEVKRCDLTERRMYVKIACPEIAVMAPELLAGYRNPLPDTPVSQAWRTAQHIMDLARREGQDYAPGTEPVVFAGLSIGNSETGNGGFFIAPEVTFRICGNGATFTADALRKVHLGAVQDEGIVQWGADTTRKSLELVALQSRDAVRAFLSVDYLQGKVNGMTADAGVGISDAPAVIKQVVKASAFPAEYEDMILNMYTRGGQTTAGGVMNAVTAAAQTVEDADIAALMEAEAPKVLAIAATAGRAGR